MTTAPVSPREPERSRRRPPWLRTVSAVFASYLAAGAALMLYERWPHYAGHPHVPFSGFPEFLAWSPVAPYLVFTELLERSGRGPGGAVVFLLVFGVLLGWTARRALRSGGSGR